MLSCPLTMPATIAAMSEADFAQSSMERTESTDQAAVGFASGAGVAKGEASLPLLRDLPAFFFAEA